MIWFFERNDETLSCETRRTAQGYEIVISRPDGSSDVRTMPTAHAFIEGLLDISGELIPQQWSPRLVRVP